MRTLWKYDVPLTGVVLSLPAGGIVRHVASQYGQPDNVQMWVEHDDVMRTVEPREFVVVGTGHLVPPAASFVGTAICASGQLVWHVYEVTP